MRRKILVRFLAQYRNVYFPGKDKVIKMLDETKVQELKYLWEQGEYYVKDYLQMAEKIDRITIMWVISRMADRFAEYAIVNKFRKDFEEALSVLKI